MQTRVALETSLATIGAPVVVDAAGLHAPVARVASALPKPSSNFLLTSLADELPTTDTRPVASAPISWQRGQIIGHGSFGKVFLGLNTTSGVLMAVKQISYRRKSSGAARSTAHMLQHEAAVDF